MANAGDFITDGGVDAEFFFQLATQSVLRLFAFLDLSSGELPLQRHGLMFGPLADENLAVLEDECRDHTLHHHRDSTAAGLAACEGSTQLVNVKANAARPGAQVSSRTWLPKSWFFTI